MKGARWLNGGAIVAAIGASACCLGPVILLALGASAAAGAVSAFFAPLRPWLFAVAFGIIGWRLWVLYRPVPKSSSEVCCETSPVTEVSCRSDVRRKERLLTWGVLGVVAVFSVSPYLLAVLPVSSNIQPLIGTDPAQIDSLKSGANVCLKIDGMTCSACTNHIRVALAKVPGVRSAIVDFDKKEACVLLDAQAPATLDQLVTAVGAAGYDAVPKEGLGR